MGTSILILFNILKTDKNIKRMNYIVNICLKLLKFQHWKVYSVSTKLSIPVNNNALCKYEIRAHFDKCVVFHKSLLKFKLFMYLKCVWKIGPQEHMEGKLNFMLVQWKW